MIFHLAVHADWEMATRQGIYAPPSLAAEGFIHCSTGEQIIDTANLFYRGRGDLILLSIEESRLVAPLRYEAPGTMNDARAALRFPHVYGRLNLDAVTAAVPMPSGHDGSFELPPALTFR
jgi:uncharacterized protein (DUF952 family)